MKLSFKEFVGYAGLEKKEITDSTGDILSCPDCDEDEFVDYNGKMKCANCGKEVNRLIV